MIKNIFLDLDGTVLDFRMCEHEAFCEMLDRFGAGNVDKNEYSNRYSEINVEQWKLLELGKITRAEVSVNRFRELFIEKGLDIPADKAAEYYEMRLSYKHYFIPHAEDVVKRLSEKYKIYIATNGHADVQHRRVREAGLEKYISGLFISEEIGYDKPSREYFERCFEMIPDFSRDETVMIGDSLSSDILGGNNAGIRTVWYSPQKKEAAGAAPDYVIHDIRALPDIIDKM